MAAQPVTEVPKKQPEKRHKVDQCVLCCVCVSYGMCSFLIHFFCNVVVVIKTNIL